VLQVAACLESFLLCLVSLGTLLELSVPWRIEMLKPASQRLFQRSFRFWVALGEVGIAVLVAELLLL